MNIGEEELNERDFFVIKDKAERLKTKKQLKLNQIIKDAIQKNTIKLINQRKKTEDFKESFKPNSLYENLVDDSNRHLVNQMPFLLFGLVETIFLEEKKGKQQIVYGCGILIDTNVILVPAKNLVFDESESLEDESDEEEQNEENKEKNENENEKKKEKDKDQEKEKDKDKDKEKNNYNIFKIEFKPLNLSPEYRSYLPSSIKVVDHYTPMNQNDNNYNSSTSSLKDKEVKTDSNKKEEETVKTDGEKVGNSWGIAFLEYPVGDIINYIYNKSKVNPLFSNKYSINRKKKNIFSYEDNSIFDKIKIDNLTDDELTKTEFFFLECLVRPTNDYSEDDIETNENTNANNIDQKIDNNEKYEIDKKDNIQINENNNNENKKEENPNKNNINNENKKDNNNNKNNNENNKNNENKNNENKNNEDNNNNENNNEINENNEENAENTEESSGFNDQQNPSLPYQFFESQYWMNFEQKFIFLKNPYQDQELGKDLLPGFIVGKYMNRFHILGMNTSTIIAIKNTEEENVENNNNNNNNENNENNNENNNKDNNNKEEEKKNPENNNDNNNIDNNNNKDNNEKNENNEKNNNNENNDNNNNENNEENYLNDSQFIHRAIRFNKELSLIINSKVQELNNQHQREYIFNERIFELIDTSIKNKEFLINLLKNNCSGLYNFLNQLKETKSLTNDDKLSLNITNESNLKFIQFCLMIIYNKLSSSIIDSKIIDFENLKIGYFPGSSIISEIIQSQSEIMTINLKNNDIYSNGIKEIMNPIFNQKKIILIGKDLKCLCLDGNKLDGKSLKYIRHLIKICPHLALINLSNNFIKGTSLRHLLHCTRDKESMSILHLNNNLLGENCGENLAGILTNLNNLNELNLSCNCLGDTPIPLILNPLKKNAAIEILYLGCNDIGPKSASYLAAFLSNNRNLKTLTLNNNPLTSAGIKSISQALSTKLVLEEINLNSTAAGDEGGAELFENMKLNKSLRRVYANNNKFYKNSMFKFGELLKKDNDDQNSEGGLEFLSLSYNDIDDECINFFAQDLISYKWLKEIKFNSNKITEKGGESILFAVLQNENINQVNLENNNTNWNFTIEELKLYRDNINIYL